MADDVTARRMHPDARLLDARRVGDEDELIALAVPALQLHTAEDIENPALRELIDQAVVRVQLGTVGQRFSDG